MEKVGQQDVMEVKDGQPSKEAVWTTVNVPERLSKVLVESKPWI